MAMRDDADDSYEAAMRAADALFARPTPQSQERSAAASGMPAEGTDAGSSPAPGERGGRILRALDEPPPPQLVALEAAHAPKRRGRKPGSKNKPKVKPLEIALADVEPLATASGAASAAPAVAVHDAEVVEGGPPLAAPTAQAEPATAMQRLEAIPAATNGSPSNGSKRFPWVRDRLKPGEGWKRRRLPRICW